MDAYLVESILRGVGGDKVRGHGHKVTCCCLLAPWTHSKGHDDNPSMVVMENFDGIIVYKCQACHRKGTLEYLLQVLWTKGYKTFGFLQALAGQKPIELVHTDEREVQELKRSTSVNARRTWDEKAHVQRSEKAFYDYKATAEADGVPEIPWEEYEPYVREGAPPYALARGLKEETCRAFELGDDTETKRLLFPIRDRKGRLVTISGRLYADRCVKCGGEWERFCRACGDMKSDHIEDPEGDLWCPEQDGKFKSQAEECVDCHTPRPPKYFHRKGFKRNLILYGEHLKDKAHDGRVYVVEGNADVLSMWQDGYRPVVGILGSDPGEVQVEKMIRQWKRIWVVGDGDDAGRKLGRKITKMVAGRIPVEIVELDDGQDPDSMSREEKLSKIGKPTSDPVD